MTNVSADGRREWKTWRRSTKGRQTVVALTLRSQPTSWRHLPSWGGGSDGGDGGWQHLGAALLSVLTVAAIIARGRSRLQERRRSRPPPTPADWGGAEKWTGRTRFDSRRCKTLNNKLTIIPASIIVSAPAPQVPEI